MRILYLIGQGEGGLPHYTAELANAVSTDHDVIVMKPEQSTADELFDPAVDVREPFQSIDVSMSKIYNREVSPTAALRGMASYREMRRITDLDADIVHETTDLFPHVKLFARAYGVDQSQPFVVTRHEVTMNRFSLSRPPVLAEELVMAMLPDVDIDQTVVHTRKQKAALGNRNADWGAIEVIPHGAYSVFGDGGSGAAPEPDTLLFFGNVVPPKGVDTLIRAVPYITEEIPDLNVIVAGDGQIPRAVEPVIEAHPENFEIHDRFIPNGEVGEFFERAQCVVLPYREQNGTKGHSGVLSTAFTFGKPVVASTAGVFPEYVGERGCGQVVPPEDPEQLAEALVYVLTNPEDRQRMAEASRRMASELSWDSIAEKHLDLYRRLLSE